MVSPCQFHLLYFLFPLYYFSVSNGLLYYKPSFPSCSTTNNYTDGSTYATNLQKLLNRLPRSALQNGGFANDTIGSPPDQVFGFMMCLADSDSFQCETCLNQAVASIVPFCPYSNSVNACFVACVLRYANLSFFEVASLSWEFTQQSSNPTVSDTESLSLIRERLMNQLADNMEPKHMIAAGHITLNSTRTMYGLVQCTLDLPMAECQRCLRSYITQLPGFFPASYWGRMFGYSCYLRYDLDPFNVTIPAPTIAAASPNDHGSKRRVETIAGVTAGSAVVLLAIIVLVVLIAWRWQTHQPAPRLHAVTLESSVTPMPPLGPRRFTLMELAAATNEFTRKIGSGAFGDVYKGELPDGEIIAVKELKMGDRLKGFENESKILGALKHRNIVALLGYCNEGGRYMLCCEFVAEGNLEEHRFGNKMRFDWLTRFNIIKGVCRGLVYLHEDSNSCTIHLDLKPSNILLCTSRGCIEPKISDFGISRLLDIDKKDHETIHRIVGSYGYMAPEYQKHGKVSPKADVYSFGIVIMEIVTGQHNCAFSQEDTADEFIKFVQSRWNDGKGNMKEVTDPTMDDEYSNLEVHRCIEIALQCIQKDPANRPDAKRMLYCLLDNKM